MVAGTHNRLFTTGILWVAGVCGLLFFVLNVVRVVNVPITYDEALTYNTYVAGTYSAIIHFQQPSANNHVLNTLLTKLLTETFGNNIFFLRAANVLAQAIYLLFSFLISNLLLKDRKWATALFLLLQLQPFLFQFFGLCRGYGLSISMMLASVYFMLRFSEHRRMLFAVLSQAFAILAAYSSFTLINFFVALPVIHIVLCSVSGKPRALRNLLLLELPLLLCSSLLLFALVAEPIKKLQMTNQLYYGGNSGFVADTVRSIIADSFFISGNTTVVNLLAGVFLLSVAVAVYYMFRTAASGRSGMFYSLCLLLLVPVLSTVVQHYLLGTRLLISRTALFFVPLYILVVTAGFHNMKSKAGDVILVSALIVSALNFFVHLNFHKTLLWDGDQYNVSVMEHMDRACSGNKLTVMITNWATPSLQYYGATSYAGHFAAIEFAPDFKQDTTADFYYIDKSDVPLMSHRFRLDTVFGNRFALMKRME